MYINYFREEAVNPEVVFSGVGDVNGDRIPDNVFLTGVKTPASPFIQNIALVVRDGRTGKITRVALSENAGYNPRLYLGDFNGDDVKDIFISIDSGGSGAFTYDYIYSFINNIPKQIFNFNDYNEEYKYTVTYKNNYKVEVVSEKNNNRFIIDISLKGQDYLSEIYDESGRLKEPISGFVNPVSGLYPVDFNGDEVYELLAYQKIAGRYNADALGYILNTLKWSGDNFTLVSQNVAIWGTEA
jgi:hypothetical protein